MGRLDGKVVLITGAASGIGRSAASMFAGEGAKVAICDIDVAGGRESEGLARQAGHDAGGDALFIETDIREEEQAKSAVAQCVAHFGKLDTLYNNAGGSTMVDGPVTEAPIDEFWRVMTLDLFGTFLMSRHAIPAIIDAGGGSVINTASNVALMALPGRDCYTAAKGGIVSLTRSMAAEYAPYKIRVNAIAPSATRTERVAAMAAKEPVIERQVETHLLGWCEPHHIAYMALYLASDASVVTTGQILPVDSGITAL
jgi:NAD(P)-dependent dehydrogenase (short-subunit alcohol dehydrogenase family)